MEGVVSDKKQSNNKIIKLRKQMGLNQQEFWSRVGVTQSGGSRYESGRGISRPVAMLIELAYSKNPAQALKRLRRGQ
jgi:transcriptional regulator with XRE-family HTH domain